MRTAVASHPRAEALDAALRVLVLARAAVGAGAARGELVRDLAPYVVHKLGSGDWRERLAHVTASLTVQELAASTRGRLRLTPAGLEIAARVLGGGALPSSWAEMRDIRLVAWVLGIGSQPARRTKALLRPEGLRAAILTRAFGLRLRGAPTPAALRQALAVVALERAFSGKLKGGSLGARTGLSAKAGRLLAAQLSVRPRDFGTDGRLMAALAAEQVGALRTDADALRTAVLRGFLDAAGPGVPATSVPGSTAAGLVAATRPDLPGFAGVVRAAAGARAEGWPGNRKAFISHVWEAVRSAHPEWGLTDIEFKAMLAEAHRTGHLMLANADLKDRKSMKDLQESAVAYKNVVWHFVRVES